MPVLKVIEAATAEEALDRCEERAADVLFTDIMLSGNLDGWDIAEQLPRGPSRPSGNLHHGLLAPTTPAGTWQPLAPKPYSPSALVRLVCDAVGQSPPHI